MRVGIGAHVVTASERLAVNGVLDAGQLSPGSRVKEFEGLFARRVGGRYGVMVNSGTDALRVALGAMKEVYGWEDGSRVLLPALTFVATMNVVLQNDLDPVLVDIDEFTYGIDLRTMFEGSNRSARCVIPVHLFGHAVRMTRGGYPDPLMVQARAAGIRVLEDSCECLGVTKVCGDIACYSTYVCHMISTGVGGMAITNRKGLEGVMRSLANHGRSLSHIPGHTKGNDIRKRFVFDRIGYSSRATEFEAAIGLEQLKGLAENIKRRRAIAARLLGGLDSYGGDLRLPWGFEESGWMMFPIVVHKWSRVDKWRLCEFLEKAGIETREMLPLINQPSYKKFRINPKAYPNADHVNRNGFYIGCHPGMTDDDVDFVVETFRRFDFSRD